MTLVYNAVPQFSQWLSQFRVICTAFLITLVTLIVRYIHFAGLSPGKTTSGTIPRNQQDFLITNPAPVIEYAPDFHIPIMGVRNRILLQKDLMKYSVSRGPWRSFYTFMTTAKPPGAS